VGNDSRGILLSTRKSNSALFVLLVSFEEVIHHSRRSRQALFSSMN
jgi:hypothetical protein